MTADAKELAFQNDVIRELVDGGWVVGDPAKYNRELALYTEDCLTFVQATQPKTWEKFEKLYPNEPEKAFIARVATQLNKVDPQATNKELRKYGTLGVLRHEVRDKSVSFKLCQFKPEHGLNPETQAMYQGNILRVVPELVYSAYVTGAQLAAIHSADAQEPTLAAARSKTKAWRIDLVLFLNGVPIVTLELKSEFKQAVHSAITQYKKTRLPKDPATNKPEPLLSFKRGALVHFAVSQYEVHMTTRLNGGDTRFVPFNRGTKEGGAGNDEAADIHRYATDYLWRDVLAPANLLDIIGRFVHLEIKDKENWDGSKYKVEELVFPRYHQWDLVKKLLGATKQEGAGHKYLAQHSAGSGKSNSIAWSAHQLSSLYDDAGNKVFDSVIVVTDRTVLDSQLQETIYQFEHADGVVARINRDEGQGSKSEKLAAALERSQHIVIVTIQTFPHVLSAIENSLTLKERRYAIIADEAHSSQSGSTARKLKEVLTTETSTDDTADDIAVSTEDMLAAAVSGRRASNNLSYYAFTATPKAKTLELFGRLPSPEEPSSKANKPQPFHVYSMRQAIEEKYILDVLKNYTSYKVAYQLAQKATAADAEVDAKRAKTKLAMWLRLHEYNIAQKVEVIVEHFRLNVADLLGGHAKAMIVTSSRKEAVRYKLGFDKYVQKKGYQHLNAMVAFSGEVEFSEKDPQAEGVLGDTFTESNMNPGLKGRDMRKAFDSNDYAVMIVAQKFQTGFDQPKLCAMYVDKKLGGIECVQTLSRLNRVYPGKLDTGTFVLDFVNDPDEILTAFQEYYQTAALTNVSDPNLLWELYDKLRDAGIFLWSEVALFSEVFFTKSKSNAAIANVCKPAMDRWHNRHEEAHKDHVKSKDLFERAKKSGDPVLIGNAEGDMKQAKQELDALGTFKADLVTFTRQYEFLSQIVDYDSTDLEKLSLFARHLAPLLREKAPEQDPVDLSSVELSHYRLSKIKQQDLLLVRDSAAGLDPASAYGTRKARDQKEEWLSQIITRLNELFITDGLTENDMVNYAYTLRDKISENVAVMKQIENNAPEQALLGDFDTAFDDAVMESGEAHKKLMNQVLTNKQTAAGLGRVVFDMLLAMSKGLGGERRSSAPPASG